MVYHEEDHKMLTDTDYDFIITPTIDSYQILVKTKQDKVHNANIEMDVAR